MEIRPAAVAGSFYPASSEALKNDISLYLKKSKKISIKNLKALIVPHAGYIYSGIVAAAGYNLLKSLPKKHYKIILIGPSHYAAFSSISASKSDFWQTPLGSVKITGSRFKEVQGSHLYEHSLEVQIPFLQSVLDDFEVLPLLLSRTDPKETAKELIKILDDNVIIIASSDLSHFHDYETASRIDSIINKAIPKLDIKNAEKCEACGNEAILALMHVAESEAWSAKLIDYKNSGDVTKNKKEVVGYGCYAFYKK